MHNLVLPNKTQLIKIQHFRILDPKKLQKYLNFLKKNLVLKKNILNLIRLISNRINFRMKPQKPLSNKFQNKN